VVERKASGIDERADWEVERRAGKGDPAADEPVEVALSLETDGGVARLVRRRKRGAGAREEDEFAVELQDGRKLVESEAHAWTRDHALPDWETWRRACCQHQEILRARLTVADDRSLVVSSLLGMEEHDRLARLLKEQQPGKLVHEIDGVLADLDQVVLVRLKTPSEDLFESERKLAGLGLERSRLSPALAVEIGRAAIERARALAERLGFAAELPRGETEADEPELRKWAEGWPAYVRRESKSGERLGERPEEAREARRGAGSSSSPPRSAGGKSKEALEASMREQGDEATRKKAARGRREGRRGRRRGAPRGEPDARAAPRDARGPARLEEREPVPGVRHRGRGPLHAPRGNGAQGHGRAPRGARRRARPGPRAPRRARGVEPRGGEARRGGEEARKACEGRRSSLSALVSQGRLDTCADLAAAARAEEESLAGEIAGLETAVASLDAELEEHRRDVDRLKELARWRTAAKRAQQRADLTALPEWKELQEAVDAAAAFAADLDALGSMAREAQEERSKARESEVNRSLGEYAA
jgi:DNA repair exonuclease SbcCD ATPase subunit